MNIDTHIHTNTNTDHLVLAIWYWLVILLTENSENSIPWMTGNTHLSESMLIIYNMCITCMDIAVWLVNTIEVYWNKYISLKLATHIHTYIHTHTHNTISNEIQNSIDTILYVLFTLKITKISIRFRIILYASLYMCIRHFINFQNRSYICKWHPWNYVI